MGQWHKCWRGAATYLKDSVYWYEFIEAADNNLGFADACKAKTWVWGMRRSKSLTSTTWDNYSANPIFPKINKDALDLWQYGSLFNDGGVTYCAITYFKTMENGPCIFQIYKLTWPSILSSVNLLLLNN